MELVQWIILALLQGLTEFLPISSSAHLILPSQVFGWPDQGIVFDVAVHLGSLIAVVSYFRKELLIMSKDWLQSVKLRQPAFSAESKLAWAVLLGTIPVGLIGLLLNQFISANLRSAWVIAITTVVFGLLLGKADSCCSGQRNEHQLTFKDVLIIGAAQALALVPGTSRSGITITAALFLGFSRQAAARYSFLLSIPVIVLASGFELEQMLAADMTIHWGYLILATAVSCVSAYACISIFLKLMDRISMRPFVIYRLLLGAALVGLLLSGVIR
ncbi:undecaprenyl-diphosphate phosphatase [Pelagibaculum spongiae]|uniref:Undecaprenyl-diphosphatase n=1 Tax=Pelagibaculum spongiae TaxID=2080658 RepID=A0A2V1GQ31_9GAMM|nr:undecaprenyl-diphosphate phosphatase [Pelagibaculum spongiae]PVZ65629.1 undecaprenyl-diphosphatase [Pelagibaculum spongiae]